MDDRVAAMCRLPWLASKMTPSAMDRRYNFTILALEPTPTGGRGGAMTRGAGILALLLLAGCSLVSARYYALVAVPGHRVAATGPPVTVEAVHLPDALDRPEVVRRAAASAETSERDRWAAPLAELMRRVLGEDLAARLPPGMVAPPGSAGADTRRLLVDVEDFAADAEGHVVLAAAWTLIGAEVAPTPAVRRTERIEIDGAPGYPAQAAVMSRALGELADRVAAALARKQP
jgi:uncharacterized protein